jgi:redox-sensitive bicupin YhaK (pirin superfamily)
VTPRTLQRRHDALRDDIGDLVTRRPLPGRSIPHLDPFLFLNHHGPQVYPPQNGGLPFGPHPHRGFETVTFILEGDLRHRDTGGAESVIRAGGVQWMTAGRGLVHAEESSPDFLRQGGPMEILQLWVNLPARLKLTAPRYVGLQREQLPVAALEGGEVSAQVISGSLPLAPGPGTVRGPIESLTGVELAVVELRGRGRLEVPVAPGRTVFLYVVRGAVEVGGAGGKAFQLLELGDDGDAVALAGAPDGLVLFGHADPLREPIAARGPFVMNTEAELAQAVRDYHAGKMGALD